MWIEILSVLLMILFAIYVGRERDKATRNAPGKLGLKVEQINEEHEN
jgi:hypothetical protein